MLIIYWLALISGAFAASDYRLESYRYSGFTPRYLEAYQNFVHAKDYIQKHLPRILNQKYLSYLRDQDMDFGSLIAIAGALVREYTINPKYYDPTYILDDYENYGRRYYLSVATATYELIDEASEKVSPIIELMETACTRPPYLDCNEVIDKMVRSNPYEYYAPARLFLYLGKISKNILRNQALFDRLTRNHEIVPYLYVHVNDNGIMTLIKSLSKAYLILNRMGSLK